jgi:predicted Zn-dependent protease
MPDLIYLDAIGERGEKATAPAPLIRLQAYGDLMLSKPQFKSSWLKTLSEVEAANSDSSIVQAALGRRDLDDHKFSEAIGHLQRSLQIDPLQPNTYVDLSEAYFQDGQAENAIAAAKSAVTLDPFAAPLQKTLVFRLINAKQYTEAEAAMEKYLQNFPEDDFMRKMLAIARQ